MDLSRAILSGHAQRQMRKRQIEPVEVQRVLESPLEIIKVQPGRVVAQAMVGRYLYRVFVDIDREPPEVVTAYRTSKAEKYRSKP